LRSFPSGNGYWSEFSTLAAKQFFTQEVMEVSEKKDGIPKPLLHITQEMNLCLLHTKVSVEVQMNISFSQHREK